MAAPQKVGWAQLRVGVMALVAMVILGVLIFLLTSSKSIFRKSVPIFTYMDDASGMLEGSPVRLNGIVVGSLEKIRLSGSKEPRRVIQFEMSVEEKFLKEIPKDSVTAISASNLLGDKFINITKGKRPETVRPGGELDSLDAQDIPELIAQSAVMLQGFQQIVKRFDALLSDVEKGKGNIGKFLRDEELYQRLNAIAAESQKLLSDVRTGKGTMSKLLYDDALYNEIRVPIRRIDEIMAELQQGNGSAGRLLKDPKLYEDVRKTVTEVNALIAQLNEGKGTAGKLLRDEELYRQLNRTMAKLDATVDKMSSGQGTVGQLMVNPQLYESMAGATRELQSLFKDIRGNPKKFLSIKLALF